MLYSKGKHRVMFVALILTSAFFAGNAYGLTETAYVSASGTNNSTCSLASPCREINGAMQATFEGGAVIILSTGEYDTPLITKSIYVIGAKGITAKVNGVVITPSTSDASILLRNLLIRQTYGEALSVNGQIANLEIDDCEFIETNTASTRNGIYIFNGGTYTLRNVKIRNFQDAGIRATGGNGLVNLLIENSTFEGCGTGVSIRGNVKALVTNSSATNNTTGFSVSFTGSGSARLLLENVVATGNSGDGVYIYEGAAAYLNNSAISFNGYGVRTTSGSYAYSYGNNRISHNTINTLGTLNPATLK